jgi:hypothetical protein
VRYQRIIAESADLSFRLLDEGYALILTVHGDHLPPTRQSAEASLACALALCGWLTGRTLHPARCWFRAINRPISNLINKLSMRRWCSTHRTMR